MIGIREDIDYKITILDRDKNRMIDDLGGVWECLFVCAYDLFHPRKANKSKWSVWMDNMKSSLFHLVEANKSFWKSHFLLTFAKLLLNLSNQITIIPQFVAISVDTFQIASILIASKSCDSPAKPFSGYSGDLHCGSPATPS